MSDTNATTTTHALGLLGRLPAEVRLMIYGYLASSYTTIYLSSPSTMRTQIKRGIPPTRPSWNPLALLHTSTALRREFIPSFRSHCTFRIHVWDLKLVERWSLGQVLFEAQPPKAVLGKRKSASAEDAVSARDELSPDSVCKSCIPVEFTFLAVNDVINLLPLVTFLQRHPEVAPSLEKSIVMELYPRAWRRGGNFGRIHTLTNLRCVTFILGSEKWQEALRRGRITAIDAAIDTNESGCWINKLHLVVALRFSEPWMMQTLHQVVPVEWEKGLELDRLSREAKLQRITVGVYLGR